MKFDPKWINIIQKQLKVLEMDENKLMKPKTSKTWHNAKAEKKKDLIMNLSWGKGRALI